MGRAPVISDHAQHCIAIFLEAPESAQVRGHFGRGRIGSAGQNSGDRSGDGARFARVVGNTRRHQKPADIRVAQAQRAVIIGKPRDLL